MYLDPIGPDESGMGCLPGSLTNSIFNRWKLELVLHVVGLFYVNESGADIVI